MRAVPPIKYTHLFKIAFNLLLVFVVNLGFTAAFGILVALNKLANPAQNFSAYLAAAPLISISAFLVADFLKMTRFYLKSMLDIVIQSFKFTLLEVLTASTAAFFLRAFSFPRSVLILGASLVFFLAIVWGWVGLTISRRLYSSGRMIIVGSTLEEAVGIANKISSRLSKLDIEIGDIVSCEDHESLFENVQKHHEVLICPDVPKDLKADLVLHCTDHNQVVFMVPQFYELTLVNTRMIQFDDTLAFMVDQLSLTFEQRVVKRIFDIVVSLIGILVTAPIMAIAWILVRLTSAGPGFYRQERVTLENRKYTIYKFRTMPVDAEKETGPVISGSQDPRVTWIGRILRRLKIDELPQLFNVLIGDMSIVGPRSERPFFVEQFALFIPGYQQRFKVKAGITGFAQVAGSYDSSPEDKLRYDLLYIKNYSILLDVKLIFETIKAILTSRLYNRTFQENQTEFTAIGSSVKMRKKPQYPLHVDDDDGEEIG